MKNTLVVYMTMGVDKGNTSITAAVHHMIPLRPIHSLGILEQPPGEEKRTEIVVETTADEADMRTKKDLLQIGGWRKSSDGKVATTFDLPRPSLGEVCQARNVSLRSEFGRGLPGFGRLGSEPGRTYACIGLPRLGT